MDKRAAGPLLPAGFAVITVGQLAVCLCAPALSLAGVLVASVIVYAGVGLALSPSQTAGLQTLSPEQNPHGVTILNTFIQIAAAVGPSLFIGVLSSVAGARSRPRAPLPPSPRRRVSRWPLLQRAPSRPRAR